MSDDLLLVLNSGSSSVKFARFRATGADEITRELRGQVTDPDGSPGFEATDAEGAEVDAPEGLARSGGREAVLDGLLEWLGALDGVAAVGHRVVHGGAEHRAPVTVNETVLEQLTALEPLAPLHQPHNLGPVRRLRRWAPDLLQVACFDTAFHRDQPPVAQWYALPRRYREQGVLRYGFHGLSYEYVAGALERLDAVAADGRCVVAHLGHGASLCALQGGRSVATTMGFTALDGLPMGRRCGSLDPGVVIHLLRQEGLSPDAVEDLLYRQSGLYGVSGLSDDMRELLASDEPAAAEAVELFVYRAVREIGSLAGALGGLDALVFTGGIGEGSPEVRQRICQGLDWLGVHLDRAAENGPADGARRLSGPDSPVAVWVIPTDEELMIARHTLALHRRPAG